MFSLHIDTARTWRGGTEPGLADGERPARDRASSGARGPSERRAPAPDGPRTRAHSSDAANRNGSLGGVETIARLDALQPDVIHAHDPHGVAMAALALSFSASSRTSGGPALVAARRVDFHLKANAFSRWKHLQVDCFIAASDAIRHMLLTDGIDPERTSPYMRGWISKPLQPLRLSTCTRSSGCRMARRWSAMSLRSCLTRASAI